MFSNASHRQNQLADEMLDFASVIPESMDLEWVKDKNFLYHFEAERIISICSLLETAGVDQRHNLKVLDLGYLHGLIPEFLHRRFPNMAFTVCDHPQSPIFTNKKYLEIIASRDYVNLVPLDLRDVGQIKQTFDLIILGEIIEHLDPTVVRQFFGDLRSLLTAKGMILITTPNDSGVLNCMLRLRGKSPVMPPFPDSMMFYPHIHFWSLDVLSSTLSRFGFKLIGVHFNNGKEGMFFSDLNRIWGSALHQICMRSIAVLTRFKPNWRGFFVALYRGADSGNSTFLSKN